MPAKYIAIFMAAIFLISCNTEEIGLSKDVNPETIYTTYNITYDETESSVNCFAQFRFAGPYGTTLALSDSSFVRLDGQTINLDSNDYRGAFYEIEKPLAGFTGSHSWMFRDINGKDYKEIFEFTPVKLQPALPASLQPQNLSLYFDGSMQADSLFVSVSDTSNATANNEESCLIAGGKAIISATIFKNQEPGPVTFHFYISRKKSLQNCPKEGGVLEQLFLLKEQKTNLVAATLIL